MVSSNESNKETGVDNSKEQSLSKSFEAKKININMVDLFCLEQIALFLKMVAEAVKIPKFTRLHLKTLRCLFQFLF